MSAVDAVMYANLLHIHVYTHITPQRSVQLENFIFGPILTDNMRFCDAIKLPYILPMLRVGHGVCVGCTCWKCCQCCAREWFVRMLLQNAIERRFYDSY